VIYPWFKRLDTLNYAIKNGCVHRFDAKAVAKLPIFLLKKTPNIGNK
jgi:hypothetical protein